LRAGKTGTVGLRPSTENKLGGRNQGEVGKRDTEGVPWEKLTQKKRNKRRPTTTKPSVRTGEKGLTSGKKSGRARDLFKPETKGQSTPKKPN